MACHEADTRLAVYYSDTERVIKMYNIYRDADIAREREPNSGGVSTAWVCAEGLKRPSIRATPSVFDYSSLEESVYWSDM